MADINGDGKPDLILAHYVHSAILWIDFSGPEPKAHHVGGAEQDGHGVGVADIDGDGKADIITTPAGSADRRRQGPVGVASRLATGRHRLSRSSATT